MDFSLDIKPTDLAVAIWNNNSYEDVLKLIIEIDKQAQDSVFTTMLFETAYVLEHVPGVENLSIKDVWKIVKKRQQVAKILEENGNL